jgi:hypothetical protein
MRSTRRGMFIVRSLVSASALGVIATTAVLVMAPAPRESVAAAAVMVSPEPEELGAILTRVGLGPEALAAVGVRGQGVPGVVGSARTALSGDGRLASLNAADDAYRADCERVSRLRRLVQSGKGDANTPDELGNARAAQAASRQALDAQLDAVFQASTAGLTGGQIATLRTLKDREDLAAPLPMRLTDRNPSEWPGIRDAFNHTEQFEVSDPDYSHAAGQLVTSVRAESPVSIADTNLGLYLAEVQNAFDQALQGR